MIRAMSTAVTGLRGHQQKLDVIGNNIANVNTVGFKMSQARFEDLLSQTIQGATGPDERGGINPSQIGLGMRISSITDIHSQGAITTTDRETDLAIEGAGYFIVGDGTGAQFYTRAGSFGLDSNGNLVNDNGLFVLGDTGVADLSPINIPLGDEMIARATENMRLAGNLDSGQRPTYSLSLGGATIGTLDLDIDIDGVGAPAVPVSINWNDNAQSIKAALENHPDINDVTVTGLGTDANPFQITFNDTVGATPPVHSVDITVNATTLDTPETILPAGYGYEYFIFDSLGNRFTVDFHFTNDGENQWLYQIEVFDQFNNQVALTPPTGGTLGFDTAGNLDPAASIINPIEFNPAGADPISIDLDFDNISQLSNASTLVVREQDGFGAGELSGFYIDRTGVVVGTYTNGMIENLGQIQTATFSNPEGLAKIGGNLFEETLNSGDAIVGNPGAGGRGLVTASALEMSNVDLAYEFTELITTSRAFQANTRVVTTSDEVLVEVVNMKR